MRIVAPLQKQTEMGKIDSIVDFKIGHNKSFWVLLFFEFLSFVTILDLDFCHNLSFWFWWLLDFLSFVRIKLN